MGNSNSNSEPREFTEQAGMPAPPPSPVTGDKWPTFWAAVEAVFPGICPDHARQSAQNHNWDPAGFIAHTLDQQEAGHSYPTKAPAQKRKRAEEIDDAGLDGQIKNQGDEFAGNRLLRRSEGFSYLSSYAKATSFLLQIAFPRLYVKDIETTFRERQYSLYPTYIALKEELNKPEHERRFGEKKGRPKPAANPTDVHEHIKRTSLVDAVTKRRAEDEALAEFNAIHRLYMAKEERDANAIPAREQEAERERLNEIQARAEGTMAECQCCFGDSPMNRMVHCTGDTPHYVCFDCAKAYVRSKIGQSQWEINCFAVENCQGTFSHDQRALFLDDNLTRALDRLEQDQVLRDAGIDNLAQCPFCPYAAEYPPVEVNKVFVCDNPDCGAVTCRLCKGPNHIPKSCEEVRSETAAEYARHQIEEDMTLALIRKCNKCQTPYLKLDGCNKIVCSKCATIQCYICQQTIRDYSHFRARNTMCYNRLHDNVDAELALEVEKAEREAREKILKENSHIKEQHLGFKFSETVQKENELQRARAQAIAEQRNRNWPPEDENLVPHLMAVVAAADRQEAQQGLAQAIQAPALAPAQGLAMQRAQNQQQPGQAAQDGEAQAQQARLAAAGEALQNAEAEGQRMRERNQIRLQQIRREREEGLAELNFEREMLEEAHRQQQALRRAHLNAIREIDEVAEVQREEILAAIEPLEEYNNAFFQRMQERRAARAAGADMAVRPYPNPLGQVPPRPGPLPNLALPLPGLQPGQPPVVPPAPVPFFNQAPMAPPGIAIPQVARPLAGNANPLMRGNRMARLPRLPRPQIREIQRPAGPRGMDIFNVALRPGPVVANAAQAPALAVIPGIVPQAQAGRRQPEIIDLTGDDDEPEVQEVPRPIAAYQPLRVRDAIPGL